MEPIEAFALYRLGKLSSDQIVSLADAWLCEGVFTDGINELSGSTNSVMADIAPIFERTMSELNEPSLTKFDAAIVLVKMKLEGIVSNTIDPEEGASFLYWNVHHEITNEYPDKEYSGDNLGLENVFFWLREIWDCNDGSMILYHTDLPREKAELKFREHLIEEAENWLSKAT